MLAEHIVHEKALTESWQNSLIFIEKMLLKAEPFFRKPTRPTLQAQTSTFLYKLLSRKIS